MLLPISSDACYQALLSHDARFDGCFFTAVTSTRIYCRPVCRVKAPKRENCLFFALAAQAEAAGFRPCLRCRPELAPQSLAWSTQDASHTLALQAAHWLDHSINTGESVPSVAMAACKLGISPRHLQRIFQAHLGISPLQYLQTRRLLCAKQLLTDTRLPMADVAHASGFASQRRFNTAFVQHYRLVPTQMRLSAVGATRAASLAKPWASATQVQLAYRPPYDTSALLEFWRTRQLDAIEMIATRADVHWAARTFSINFSGHAYSGWIHLAFDPVRPLVCLHLSDSLCPVLPAVIARVRAALDLDADPQAIDAVLGPHFPGSSSGIRVPGSFDGFEVAVRAILGQQITVAAARTLAQRLVHAFGQPIQTPWHALSRLFPSACTLAAVNPAALGELGIVRQRQAAIIALSRAVESGALNLNTPVQALGAIEQLKTLPGIGDWTANTIALRALRWPDAFPAGDVALHNALGLRGEKNPTRACEAASQAWRPWRSYAVLRLWQGPVNPAG